MTKLYLFVLIFLFSFWTNAQPDMTYIQKIPGTTIQFTMVAVPSGKFILGSKSILADADESPQVEIELSSFWMAEHEVTFEEWDGYFKDASLPQSKTIDGITRATPQYIDLTWGMGRDSNHPVNSMSHQAAMMYCKWLYSKTDYFFRLPTEAEWEYSCKAGEIKSFDLSTLDEIGFFKDNSNGKFQHVKKKKPNAWGLFDMLGNLSEWTLDHYDPQYNQNISSRDPETVRAPQYSPTVRGGSFKDDVNQLRCSNRISSLPGWNKRDPQIPKSRWWLTDGMFVGFRVIRPAHQPPKAEIENFYNQYLR